VDHDGARVAVDHVREPRAVHGPEGLLRFFYDDGSDNSSRVEELLAEIEAERRK
jgi:hypothetical protein